MMAGNGLAKSRNHIHFALVEHAIEECVRRFADPVRLSTATRAGCNATEARPRMRVCVGASMNNICFTISGLWGLAGPGPWRVIVRALAYDRPKRCSEHSHDVFVSRNHPGVQETGPSLNRIPTAMRWNSG